MARGAVFVLAALLVESPVALAHESVDCPERDAFFSEVRARSSRADALGEALPKMIAVELSAGEGGAIDGVLTLRAEGASDNVRRIRGAACDEVVRALALIAALAIDAEDAPVLAAAPSRVVVTRTIAEESLARSPEWQLAAGAHVGMTFGVMPSAAITAPVFVELARTSAPSSLFDPSVRLGFSWATGERALASVGAARFTLFGARAEGCPLAVTFFDFRATPCAALEVGALTGRGDGVPNGASVSSLWFAAGVAGRVRWSGLAPVFVELEGGVRAPLIRETFAFRPDIEVFRAAPIAADASFGAGVNF